MPTDEQTSKRYMYDDPDWNAKAPTGQPQADADTDVVVTWTRHLTNGALAERLTKAADSARRFTAYERELLMREAAIRLARRKDEAQ